MVAYRETVTSSKIIYEGPIFSVETQDVDLYNGKKLKEILFGTCLQLAF